jgi:hypothetical protein
VFVCFFGDFSLTLAQKIFLVVAISGILTREDALALIPVTILFGYIFLIKDNYRGKMNKMHIYALVLVCASILLFLYRSRAVPQALSLQYNFKGLFLNLGYSFNLMGLTHFNTVSMILIYGWFILLAALFLLFIYFHRLSLSKNMIILPVCILVSSSPGLVLTRTDLLLFPITFAMLCICKMSMDVDKTRITKYFVSGMVIWAFIGSAYISYIGSLYYHPNSTDRVYINSNVVYGMYGDLKMPVQRVSRIKERLKNFGIFSALSHEEFRKLNREATMNGKRYPESEDELFRPLLKVLKP